MATFKHINSKNARYSDAEKYLLFEHDEFTMKPILDENGRLIPREDYRIAALNCEGQDFAIACMRANLQYGKNLDRRDVKSHHYIISFDPRDSADNGLTVDRAQELGEQFCRDHFPGHQALVCTHPDGHNHTGNIHIHIIINSLRIEDVPVLPYGVASMDELNELLSAARSELQESREKLKSIETVLSGKKALQKQLLTYWETKDVRQEYKALKTAKARAEYAQMHEREFKLSNAAAKYFKDHGITKLPGTKALQAEIQQLTSEKNARYKDYREKQRRVKELETVKSNIENMLGHTKEKRHELIPS